MRNVFSMHSLLMFTIALTPFSALAGGGTTDQDLYQASQDLSSGIRSEQQEEFILALEAQNDALLRLSEGDFTSRDVEYQQGQFQTLLRQFEPAEYQSQIDVIVLPLSEELVESRMEKLEAISNELTDEQHALIEQIFAETQRQVQQLPVSPDSTRELIALQESMEVQLESQLGADAALLDAMTESLETTTLMSNKTNVGCVNAMLDTVNFSINAMMAYNEATALRSDVQNGYSCLGPVCSNQATAAYNNFHDVYVISQVMLSVSTLMAYDSDFAKYTYQLILTAQPVLTSGISNAHKVALKTNNTHAKKARELGTTASVSLQFLASSTKQCGGF